MDEARGTQHAAVLQAQSRNDQESSNFFHQGKNDPSKENAVTFSSAFLSSFFKSCCNQQNPLII